jgi:hypothetical protein
MSDTNNSELLKNVSSAFGMVNKAWCYLYDYANGLPSGTTIYSRYGVLAGGLGVTAAIQKYEASAKTNTDTEQLLLEMGGQVPVVGTGFSVAAWVHEKVGDIFDGGPNEARLTQSLLSISQYLSGKFEASSVIGDKKIGAELMQQTVGQVTLKLGSTSSFVDTPTDAPTRISSNYITDTSANDHLVEIKSGGKVWDAFVSQQNAANGFANWNDFKAAVAASNPSIADLNNISAGTKLYMPEKMSNGSITYNFAGGTAINSNAITGEYQMVVQNADGGQTVYSRATDGDAGYVVHQVTTNQAGQEVFAFEGYQTSLDADVKPVNTVTHQDTNADGKIDQTTTTIQVTDTAQEVKVEDGAGNVVTDTMTEGGNTYDLQEVADRVEVEHVLSPEVRANNVDVGYWHDFTLDTSDMIVVDIPVSPVYVPPTYWAEPWVPFDMGAFYESVSTKNDLAKSIAASTPVVLDANQHGISAAQLAARDSNADGQLSGTELSNLSLWKDLNENGFIETGELTAVATAVSAMNARDYGFYTSGNTQRGAGVVGTPVYGGTAPIVAVPNSNYDALRNSDNYFYLGATGAFTYTVNWTANQIKINYNNRSYMIGTSGNDSFDGSYYSANSPLWKEAA